MHSRPSLFYAGFVDKYDPEWCSWVGGTGHFSFSRQMEAGQANFKVFTRNLVPLLDAEGAKQLQDIEASFPAAAQLQRHLAMSAKLGVPHTHPAFELLLQQCLELMKKYEADWTLFWRQLAELRARMGQQQQGGGGLDAGVVAEVMKPAFGSEEHLTREQLVRGLCEMLHM